MNREILFRGKRVDNGEWVYGFIFYDVEKCWEKGIENKYFIKSVNNGNNYEVIQKTIGQYTGLTDKNDKKIFEGDKVKAKFYGKDVDGEIGFNSGCFLLWNSCVSDNQLFIFTDIEVIGTIHDGDNK